MSSRISRREFLRNTGLAAATAALARERLFAAATPISARSPNAKLNIASIGCGGRGKDHLGTEASERLVALCDVDAKAIANGLKTAPDAKTFSDYRKMFDVMGKDIDAVFVATPDHNHAAASMLAITAGKHCYTEKPMAWSVQEARTMAEAAAKYKVATQMGNQHHANQGNRKVVEWIRDGAIGDVKEVHTWTNRPIWPQGITERPPSKPVPEGLDWDCWIGPAPFREFHDGLHGFKWRGWFDFGCGAIGDMGCHTWDNVYWSMQPDYPEYVELLEINGPGGKETFAKQTKFKWVFPAKGSRPAFVAFWYSGGLKPPTPEELAADPGPASAPAKGGKEGAKGAKDTKVAKGGGRQLPGSGNLYIGTKGKLLVQGDYGDSPRLIPEAAMQAYQEEHKGKVSKNAIEPAPTEPQKRMDAHHYEFILAARGEKPWNFPKSNFADYAGPMTELMLLGVIAEKIGEVGLKIECDPLKREVKTSRALALIGRQYRKGWTL